MLGPMGAGSRVEYGVTGDAVNVAARLQSEARPGSVLVGDATRRQCEPAFDWGDSATFELYLAGEMYRLFGAYSSLEILT